MYVGAPVLLLGLMLTANCVAEVPVFFYSGAIIQRLGVLTTMQLSLGAYALRFLAYLVRQISHQVFRQTVVHKTLSTPHRACLGGPACGCCCVWSCFRARHWGVRGRQARSTVEEWPLLDWAPQPRAYLPGTRLAARNVDTMWSTCHHRLYSGVGMGTGAVVGGMLYGAYGASNVFLLGLVCVVAAAFCLGWQQWARRSHVEEYQSLQS